MHWERAETASKHALEAEGLGLCMAARARSRSPVRRSATAARLAASAKSESRKCEQLANILQRGLPPARATELDWHGGSIGSERSPTSDDEREALGHRAAEQLHAAAASFSRASRHYEAHRMQLVRRESRAAQAKSAAEPPEALSALM